MEHYVAESRRPLAKCLTDVASCDLYIGIFAWRYGYIPPNSERSITEKEFREALRCDKEFLLFLADPQACWPEKYQDNGKGEGRIRNLRADIEAQYLADYFSTPEDLAAKVATAVANWSQPNRTPHDVEREHRLLKTWLYDRRPLERDRARHALRNMASVRYITMLRQFILDERGTVKDRSSYLADIITLCSNRAEAIVTLIDLLRDTDRELKKMAVFHIGELWLAGRQIRPEVLDLLPAVAATRDPELLYFLIHAIEKIISVRRYGRTDEAVPLSLVECLEIMVSVPSSGWHRPTRAQVALEIVTRKRRGVRYPQYESQ